MTELAAIGSEPVVQNKAAAAARAKMITQTPTSTLVNDCSPWLLLRGLGRERQHWGEFPNVLERSLQAQVDMLDLPGFGSERARPSPVRMSTIARDVRTRWHAQGGGTVNLLGISLGGMAAMAWARRFPADVARTVVINSSAANLAWPWERFAPATIWPLVATRRRNRDLREYVLLRATTHLPPEAIRALVRDRARLNLPDPSTGAVASQLLAAFWFRARPISPPTLVLASTGDRLVSPGCSRRLATLLRADCQFHPTAGHDLPLEDPLWVANRVADWVHARPL